MSKRVAGPINTAISETYVDRVVVRGFDLCDDLIGKIGITEYFLILLTGKKPTPELQQLLDACFVAIAEHGMVGTILAARSTYNAAPGALQGAVAAGILGCGDVVLGAAEQAGQLYEKIRARQGQSSSQASLDDAVSAVCRDLVASKAQLPGFGHPEHKPVDPRAQALLRLAHKLGTAGRAVETAEAIERLAPAIFDRELPMNVTGAIGAVMMDAGFPKEMLRSVSLIARTFSIVAHLWEERTEHTWRNISRHIQANVHYTGTDPKDGTPSHD